MAYTIDSAGELAKQLDRFTSSNVHQLAGQVANLDFWLDEVDHILATIDDYPRRFKRLRDAQVAWVRAHGTKVSDYCPICREGCEFGPQSPEPPKRIPSEQMDVARGRLRSSTMRLLLRCYHAGLVDEQVVRAASDRLGLSLEPEDLEPPSAPPDRF
jgi:hypothetical protein